MSVFKMSVCSVPQDETANLRQRGGGGQVRMLLSAARIASPLRRTRRP